MNIPPSRYGSPPPAMPIRTQAAEAAPPPAPQASPFAGAAGDNNTDTRNNRRALEALMVSERRVRRRLEPDPSGQAASWRSAPTAQDQDAGQSSPRSSSPEETVGTGMIPTTVFPMAGSKRYLIADEPTGHFRNALHRGAKATGSASGPSAAGAGGGVRFVDAFAGTGAVTLYMSAQGKLQPGSILNERDPYRYLTHKYVLEKPSDLKEELRKAHYDIKQTYYKAINSLDAQVSETELAQWVAEREHGAEAAKDMDPGAKQALLRECLQNWVETEEIDKAKNASLRQPLNDYVRNRIAEFADHERNPLDLPVNAALYLLAQHNTVRGGAPVTITLESGTAHASRVSLGGGVNIENRMIAKVVGPEKGQPRTSKLRIDASFKRMSKKIDDAHAVLKDKGLQLSRNDGWQLVQTLGAGDFAVVDPAYWEPRGKKRVVTYAATASVPEVAVRGYLDLVHKHVLPAWENGARVVMTNRYEPFLVGILHNMGWIVEGPTDPSTRARKGDGKLSELVALNFDSSGAIRPLVKNPAPSYQIPEEFDRIVRLTRRRRAGAGPARVRRATNASAAQPPQPDVTERRIEEDDA